MIAVDPSKTSGNDRYRAAEIDCLHQADLADFPDTFILHPDNARQNPYGLHAVIAVAVRRVLLAV
jgi:hypothetical protein